MAAFVFDTLYHFHWDKCDLRVRKIGFTADDAASFKVKVPRASRAGSNDVLSGKQVAMGLARIERSVRTIGKAKGLACWQEQLKWLLHPSQPELNASLRALMLRTC